MHYGTEHLEVVALDRVDVWTFGLDRLCRIFWDKSTGLELGTIAILSGNVNL